MQGSAEQRMGMANERGMCGVLGSLVKQGFEAARGAVEKQRADSGVLRQVITLTKLTRVLLVPSEHPATLQPAMLSCMDPVALTRQLVDIESITGNEGRVG